MLQWLLFYLIRLWRPWSNDRVEFKSPPPTGWGARFHPTRLYEERFSCAPYAVFDTCGSLTSACWTEWRTPLQHSWSGKTIFHLQPVGLRGRWKCGSWLIRRSGLLSGLDNTLTHTINLFDEVVHEPCEACQSCLACTGFAQSSSHIPQWRTGCWYSILSVCRGSWSVQLLWAICMLPHFSLTRQIITHFGSHG